MLRPSDFLRPWRVTRLIDDRLSGQEGRFDGTAVFLPEGEGLRYREEGVLRLGAGPPLAAHRDTLWRWEGGEVAVLFPDGRPFHRFRPEGEAPGTEHPCGRDLYRVIYGFAAWPRWEARWTVTGPAKDYRMRSSYEPV